MKLYYERGDIRLWHGDCLEFLPTLETGSVDAVVTSPPYNLGTTSGGGCNSSSLSRMAKMGGGYGTHADAMPHADYVDWQRRVLRACWDVLSNEGAIFYNHKPRVQNGELQMPLELNPGLPLRQIVIWDRSSCVNISHRFYGISHEWVMVLARHGFQLSEISESSFGDVWRILPESGSDHPAPFPVGLPVRILSSVNAAIVIDPFSGSGTTAVACIRTGRRFVGCELEERYCEIAAKRCDRELDQGKLFTAPPPKAVQRSLMGDGA